MDFHDQHNEFEELLQHHAGKHRMFPSDRLWQQIQTELHGQDRWPALTVACISIIVLLTLATAFLQGNHLQMATTSPAAMPTPAPLPSLSEVVNERVNTSKLTRQTMDLAASRMAALDHESVPAQVMAQAETSAPATTAPSNAFATVPPAAATIETTVSEEKPVGVTTLAIIDKPGLAPKMPQLPQPMALLQTQPTAKAFQLNKPKSSRFSISYFGGISSSYRLLTDNNYRPYTTGSYVVVPTNAYFNLDVNQVVNQAPSVGFELGAVAGYWLSPKLRIYAGLQVNYREYKIRGYGYAYEPAAIALRGADTLNTLSQYRLNSNSNMANSQPVTLHNRGIELSVPMGLQWEPLRWRRLSLGVGANVQPTYVLNKTPYVVSTDYKSYAQSPELMRQFNFNTSLETYLRYQPVGKAYSFSLGPQVRYQQLPTLSKRYPIREYLYDYGVKFSFTKSL